jgi:hypothetical protein
VVAVVVIGSDYITLTVYVHIRKEGRKEGRILRKEGRKEGADLIY